MLFEAHNDLPAMYRYIAKIYPAISSLVLVKDTDLTINKTGYHPEIEGIISKDGEKIVFAEVITLSNLMSGTIRGPGILEAYLVLQS